LVGAIATVATLVYLAIQIRSNTLAVRSTAAQSVHESFATWYRMLAGDAGLSELMAKGLRDYSVLSKTERARFASTLMAILLCTQDAFIKWREGTLAPDRGALIRDLREPGVHERQTLRQVGLAVRGLQQGSPGLHRNQGQPSEEHALPGNTALRIDPHQLVAVTRERGLPRGSDLRRAHEADHSGIEGQVEPGTPSDARTERGPVFASVISTRSAVGKRFREILAAPETKGLNLPAASTGAGSRLL
jgi:hypothetical protein